MRDMMWRAGWIRFLALACIGACSTERANIPSVESVPELSLVLSASVLLGGESPELSDNYLSGVSAAIFTDSSTVAAVDPFKKRVSLFAVDGRFLASFGEAGGGPGEFRSIDGLVRLTPGVVAVWDRALARVTRINTEDASTQVVSMESVDITRDDFIGAFGETGWVFRDNLLPRGSSSKEWSAVSKEQLQFVLVSPAGTGRRTITELEGDEKVTRTQSWAGEGGMSIANVSNVHPIFGSRLFSAVDQSGLITALSDSLNVQRFGIDGQVLSASSRSAQGTLATPRVVAETRAAILDSIRSAPSLGMVSVAGLSMDLRSRAIETAEDLPVRPRVPEFTRLILSSDESLWLERFAVPSDEWKEWLQLDLNLQPKAVLRIPRLYHVHDLRSDFALIEQVDSLGVERLFAVPIASSGTSN